VPPIIRFIVNLLAVVLLLALSGCQTAMTTSQKPETLTAVPNEWPLRFEKHSFSAHCYDTTGCKVLYATEYLVMDDDDKTRPSSASIGKNYRDGWSGGYLGIRNFPAPAVVTWKSKDGVSHAANIDIGEIFKDQMILHRVKAEEIPEGASIASPEIILEVNDRNVNVYMKAYIPLKEPRIPGNQYSTHANELMLAYSRTY